MLHLIRSAFIAVALLAAPTLAMTQETTPTSPSPPDQPTTGPGGAEYAFGGVRTSRIDTEAGGLWLFEPTADGTSSSPVAAGPLPLVLFLTGCCDGEGRAGADEGADFQLWIEHLARRGAVVVYPMYREATAQADVAAGVRAALAELDAAGHTSVDTAQFAAFGMSTGAVLAANYAATAVAEGLPAPAALVIGQPGGTIAPGDLSTIPPSSMVLVLVGDLDDMVGDTTAKAIWAQLGAMPLDSRDYITLVSDDHGDPALVADHFLSTTAEWEWLATTGVDALDWYGTWKLLNGLMGCAFTGEWCEYALGDTPEQRFMETWSDGVPVNELIVTDDPGVP